jgi:hypothetical protein
VVRFISRVFNSQSFGRTGEHAGNTRSGAESAAEQANVNGNKIIESGAAIRFTTTTSIYCISVRSNTATIRHLFFCADLSMNISDSAIAGNTATLLVHGDDNSVSVTFSGCHFDTFEQTAFAAGLFESDSLAHLELFGSADFSVVS